MTEVERWARVSPRERELFLLFLAGLSGKECADRMNINFRTAFCFKANLRRKLNLANDIQLVLFGVRMGLIDETGTVYRNAGGKLAAGAAETIREKPAENFASGG